MTKLIVGLGNPGEKYEKTRHNVGFMVLEALAHRLEVKLNLDPELKARIAETNLDGEKIILACPTTFMNNSGEAVAAIARKFKVELENVWTVSDDVDLELGQIRVRREGSAGGHKGLQSIIDHLKDQKFTRFRIGVGATPEHIALEDWVLSKFNPDELETLEKIMQIVIERIIDGLKNGLENMTENL